MVMIASYRGAILEHSHSELTSFFITAARRRPVVPPAPACRCLLEMKGRNLGASDPGRKDAPQMKPIGEASRNTAACILFGLAGYIIVERRKVLTTTQAKHQCRFCFLLSSFIFRDVPTQ